MSTDISLTTTGVVAALVVGTLAAIQPTMIRAEHGAQLVDDFHAAFGKHRATEALWDGEDHHGRLLANTCLEANDRMHLPNGPLSHVYRFSHAPTMQLAAGAVKSAVRPGLFSSRI